MRISGTYDVLELSKDKLVISQYSKLTDKTTTYSFHKMFQTDTEKKQ